VLIYQAIEKLLVATEPLDTTVSPEEQERYEKGRDGPPEDLFELMMAFSMPFIMCYGFATCSGIYMFTPVGEREYKTKPILNLAGVHSFQYYVGLFIADCTLYVPPVLLFAIMMVALDIRAYSENMDQFLLLVVGFGPALIALTYFVSQAFATGNSAMKCLVPLYLLIGTIGPLIVVIILFKRGEDGAA
jgi:ABC-type multidrug transport system permease subunit